MAYNGAASCLYGGWQGFSATEANLGRIGTNPENDAKWVIDAQVQLRYNTDLTPQAKFNLRETVKQIGKYYGREGTAAPLAKAMYRRARRLWGAGKRPSYPLLNTRQRQAIYNAWGTVPNNPSSAELAYFYTHPRGFDPSAPAELSLRNVQARNRWEALPGDYATSRTTKNHYTALYNSLRARNEHPAWMTGNRDAILQWMRDRDVLLRKYQGIHDDEGTTWGSTATTFLTAHPRAAYHNPMADARTARGQTVDAYRAEFANSQQPFGTFGELDLIPADDGAVCLYLFFHLFTLHFSLTDGINRWRWRRSRFRVWLWVHR